MDSGDIGLFGRPDTASLAQLEERGSHNPKVVSSILTTRIFLFSLGTIKAKPMSRKVIWRCLTVLNNFSTLGLRNHYQREIVKEKCLLVEWTQRLTRWHIVVVSKQFILGISSLFQNNPQWYLSFFHFPWEIGLTANTALTRHRDVMFSCR